MNVGRNNLAVPLPLSCADAVAHMADLNPGFSVKRRCGAGRLAHPKRAQHGASSGIWFYLGNSMNYRLLLYCTSEDGMELVITLGENDRVGGGILGEITLVPNCLLLASLELAWSVKRPNRANRALSDESRCYTCFCVLSLQTAIDEERLVHASLPITGIYPI